MTIFASVSAWSNSPDNSTSSRIHAQTKAILDSSAQTRSLISRSHVYGNDSSVISVLRDRNFLSGEFFEQTAFLWTDRDSTDGIYPGNAVISKPKSRAAYQLFDKVSITPDKKVKYAVGDTVDIFKTLGIVRFNGDQADLVKKIGRARIVEISDNEISAEIYRMNDVVSGKERIAPYRPFSSQWIDTLIEPDKSIQGTVFLKAESGRTSPLFQTLIIDKGASDGVAIGDIFAVYNSGKNIPSSISAICFTAHVSLKSSSIITIRLIDEQIKKGDKAILIRRTHFQRGDN